MTLNFDPRAKATTLYHGEFRPMFIGGKWVAAQSDEVMQALNPATGEVLATVP
ncbi:MAG: betaine-aldehyde dehydrogenase, partial [Mesorhizobium sp.]